MAALIRSYSVDGVQCVNNSGGNARYPKADSLVVTWDSTWAPYIQATMTGPPPSAADLTAIEPREGWRTRLTVTARNEFDRAIKAVTLDLGIRSRLRRHSLTDSGFTLQLATDEARMQDFAQDVPYNTGSSGSSQWASTLVSDAITLVLGATFVRESGYPDVSVAAADMQWDAGVPLWDYVSQLAEAAGARVWADENHVIHWAAPTFSADNELRYMTDGIIAVDDVVSRDDPSWANYAIVAYDGNSPAQLVSSGSSSTARKALVVRRPRRKPAGNAATKVRAAAQARGRNLAIYAVLDLAVRPLMRYQVTYEGLVWQGRVQSVSWNVTEGTMFVVLNVVE